MNASPALTLESLDSKIDFRFFELDAKIDFKFDMLDSKIDSALKTMNEKFDVVDARFESVDAKFDSVLEVMMRGFESVYERFDHGDQEFRDIKNRVIHFEGSMEEVQYSLAVLTKAEEKDAEATINHELRLQRLEKVNKIKAIPATHLIDIQV